MMEPIAMRKSPIKDFAFILEDDNLEEDSFKSIKLEMNEEEDEIVRQNVHLNQGAENSENTDLATYDKRSSISAAKKLLFLTTSVEEETLPIISITPMTPPELSPDGHCTVSLNSPSPLFNSQNPRGSLSMSPNLYWGPQSPKMGQIETEGKDFFAFRDSIVANVMEEVGELVDFESDGGMRGSWLLTEIDHWDNEKERIIVLCERSMLIIKYDFIGMRKEDFRRIGLSVIDKIIQGELKYPERSLAPHLNGIAGGLVGVMKDCIIPKVTESVLSVGSAVLAKKSNLQSNSPPNSPNSGGASGSNNVKIETEIGEEAVESDIRSPKTSLISALSLENFEPKTRNVQGIRIMWNQDLPLSFLQKWNPFAKTIPWLTLSSHPLLWHKGSNGGGVNRSFDVESFSKELVEVLSHGGGSGPSDSSPMCRIEYKAIIIETYLNIASLLHNANSLGFYKVRGKVSF